MSPLGTACLDIFSPLPGAREVMTQVERLSSRDTKIALRSVRIAACSCGRGKRACMVAPAWVVQPPHSAREPGATNRTHGIFIVQVEPIEGDARGETRRAGGNPEALPAFGPAVAEIRVLVDVGLVDVDQQMPIALSAGQNILELLDERLSLLRIGPSQQLLGFLPRQLEAVQGRAECLAAAEAAKALTHIQHQPLEGPPWCRVGPLSGWGGGRTLGGADGVSKRRRNLSAKGGRPPVRRNPSASGPWAL